MSHNVPGFDGTKQQDKQSETKWDQRKRCDRAADKHYSRRLELDKLAEDRRLRDEIKEVWE